MNPLTASGWLVRITGLVLLVLGLLIWTGAATAIVPIHMLIGIVLVLSLWATAALAVRAGAKPVLPIVAAAWGILVVVLGVNQQTIMPGDGHAVVQIAHLLIGIVAIGLGEALVAAGRRGSAAAA